MLGREVERSEASPSLSCTFTTGGDPVGGVCMKSLRSLAEKRILGSSEEEGIVNESAVGGVSLRSGGGGTSRSREFLRGCAYVWLGIGTELLDRPASGMENDPWECWRRLRPRAEVLRDEDGPLEKGRMVGCCDIDGR